MSNIKTKLESIEIAQKQLEAMKFRTIEKALRSNSPGDMVKANEILSAMQKKASEQEPRAFLIDPLQFNSNLGYKDKSFSLTYTTLKRMSKTPIVNSIIKTRKNQVADFAESQEDK